MDERWKLPHAEIRVTVQPPSGWHITVELSPCVAGAVGRPIMDASASGARP